jgi:hypothetical protein
MSAPMNVMGTSRRAVGCDGAVVVPGPAGRTCGIAAGVAVLTLAATSAQAAAIGTPVVDLRIWGITEAPNDFTGGPISHGPLLEFATELDLQDGSVVRQADIGNASNGQVVYAEAGVADDGATFWVIADTPNHFQNADRRFIGSESQVTIYQSYTKDSADALLTYTYSRADVGAFFSVENGPQCQRDEPFCLRAGMISLVELYDAGGNSNSEGTGLNMALVWSSGNPLWQSRVDGVTSWPWQVEQSGIGGFLEYVVGLDGPVTTPIDLSGIGVGEEFTVVYTLYAYALDTSADAGLFRTAEVFARDPLGGNSGVSFDLSGLTPTNNPSVRPAAVPLPGGAWLFATAALGVAGMVRRRR